MMRLVKDVIECTTNRNQTQWDKDGRRGDEKRWEGQKEQKVELEYSMWEK